MLYGFQSAFIFLNYLFDPGSKAVSYVEKIVFIANSLTQDWEKLSELPCTMQLKSDGARPVLMPLCGAALLIWVRWAGIPLSDIVQKVNTIPGDFHLPFWYPGTLGPKSPNVALPNNTDSNHLLVLGI